MSKKPKIDEKRGKMIKNGKKMVKTMKNGKNGGRQNYKVVWW
jgi:hypothetical protein